MTLHLIELEKSPIFAQLQLEEALLRLSDQSYCLINRGSSRAIVMGISGKGEEWIYQDRALLEKVPIIKRFSGGGTVIVDEDTLFVTFIFPKKVLSLSFPEPILRFAENFYKKAFVIEGFALSENDFVIGDRKCGGNALYIQKERWLLHTTFLWDYQKENMDLLKMPPTSPKYREKRSHEEFLCRLKDYAPSQEQLIGAIKKQLAKEYPLQAAQQNQLMQLVQKPHRKSTTRLAPLPL